MQIQILVKQRDPESTVQKRTVKAGTGEDSTLEDKALEKKMRETSFIITRTTANLQLESGIRLFL